MKDFFPPGIFSLHAEVLLPLTNSESLITQHLPSVVVKQINIRQRKGTWAERRKRGVREGGGVESLPCAAALGLHRAVGGPHYPYRNGRTYTAQFRQLALVAVLIQSQHMIPCHLTKNVDT